MGTAFPSHQCLQRFLRVSRIRAGFDVGATVLDLLGTGRGDAMIRIVFVKPTPRIFSRVAADFYIVFATAN